MATAQIEEDLFECSVCLNYMLDRNPRSLLCLHTFCEDCLKQLMSNKKIRCPTCRKITELNSDNVQELIVNFHLLRIKDIDTKRQNSFKGNPENKLKSKCQICDIKTPVYQCKDCPQLMCESCKNDHNDMFEGHALFEMCMKHEESITHLCKKCVRQLCMKCAVLDHKEHKAHFIDYTKGTKELKEEVKTLHSNIKEEIKHIDSHLESSRIYHEITLGLDKSLAERRHYYLQQVKQIEKLSGALKKKSEEYDRIQKSCIEARDQCNVGVASLKALTDDSPGFCNRYSQVRPRAQQVIEDVRQNLQTKYEPPLFVLTRQTLKPVTINIKNIKPGMMSLVTERLLLDIPRSVEINCKEQIAFVGDDVVLVAYSRSKHVIRLNGRGGVVARYYSKTKREEVTGVSVYDNRIYIVQKSTITVISQNHQEDTVVYKPDVPKIEKILVVDKSTVYISDFNNPGKVYKYNTESNQTEVVVEDLKNPSYMSVMYTLEGPRYILTEWGEHRINVYDQRWNLLNRIGGGPGSGQGKIDHPHATAVTECGLLVADRDNKRITHYSLKGQFLGQVITRQDDLDCYPYGIVYRYPFLWVCGNRDTVKCYQVQYQ